MGKKYPLFLKELCPKHVRENSFEASPGGMSGVLNYQTPYGTPGGGNNTQDPSRFSSSEKTVNHMNNQVTGSSVAVPKFPERPDRQSSSGEAIHPASMQDKSGYENSAPDGEIDTPHIISFDSHSNPEDPDHTQTDRTADVEHPNTPESDLSEPAPAAKADQAKADNPLNPDQTYDKDVDKIFKKKQTPTPDEIMSALQYELGRMVKKDKTIAKRMVLKNLKDNPHFYSQLDMLNMDDKKMKVDETQVSKTKAVLDEMIAARQKKAPPQLPQLDEIFKDLKDRRFGTNQKQS